MDDDSTQTQKMEELKKAYAEIMLNTTKEAAVKIMVAENKANRFKKQMLDSKQEALNMLIRFKNMADSKFAEMEMLSLSQRRKIVELESQVHKSEAVVNGLRSKLKEMKHELHKMNEMKGELQKMKHTRVQPLDNIIANRFATSNEDVSHDNRLVTSSSSLYYSSLKRNDTSLHQLNMTCSSEAGDAFKKIACQTSSSEEKNSVDNYNLPSIIRRVKKPQLYRPGCTQRIHALDRNQLIEKFSSSVHTCDKSSMKKKIVNTGQSKKNFSRSGGLLDKCCSFSVPCRKNRSSFRKPRTSLWTMKAPSETYPSDSETCKSPDKKNTKSSEDPSVETNETDNRALDFTSTTLASLNTTKGSELECAVAGDQVLKAKSDLKTQENQLLENSEILELSLHHNQTEIPSSSSEMIAGGLTETADDKFHKFTFRRKRKKISLSSLDESTYLENNTSKKSTYEMQRNGSEQPKSSLTVESSRDDRRLMLVARQLISLKEKKTWK